MNITSTVAAACRGIAGIGDAPLAVEVRDGLFNVELDLDGQT